MSKRRINRQQLTRIAKKQQSFQEEKYQEGLARGLVLIRFNRSVEIEDPDGRIFRCSIRPNLDTLVAGDNILWQPEGPNQGVIVSLYPRSTLLARPTSAGLKKPVAANITQMIVVIAPKPVISWPLLDSYLIMAETLNLQALIVLNKTDLPSEELQTRLLQDYQSLPYPLILLNQEEDAGFETLQKALQQQVSVFIGQSGVGKSSIISKILPHETSITTQQLSMHTELGQHTTSNSRYYHLPTGGALIDSPGVREFSLWNMNAQTLAQGYVEWKPYISLCKFRNCTHQDTPHCAVIAALNKGDISNHRYQNYLKLISMMDNGDKKNELVIK